MLSYIINLSTFNSSTHDVFIKGQNLKTLYHTLHYTLQAIKSFLCLNNRSLNVHRCRDRSLMCKLACRVARGGRDFHERTRVRSNFKPP
jgi:hypothetical protein